VRGSRIHIPGCALLDTMSSLCASLSNTRATATCLGGLSVPIADTILQKDDDTNTGYLDCVRFTQSSNSYSHPSGLIDRRSPIPPIRYL
jgi:hypothetical protein